MAEKKTAEKPKYLLTVVAEYDEYPDKEEIVEVLDAIRSYGGIRSAFLEMPKPQQIDVRNWV